MHDATPWTISAGREAKSARRPTSTEGAMSLKQSVTSGIMTDGGDESATVGLLLSALAPILDRLSTTVGLVHRIELLANVSSVSRL